MNKNFKDFQSIPELKEYIRAEGTETTRFPIRFILIENLDDWRELIQFLRFQAKKSIFLSELCYDDNFPYIENLKEQIRQSNEENILILPLSEYIRFFNSNFLKELAILEQVGKKRVYIPLFKISNIFNKEMSGISRYNVNELPPVMMVSGKDSIILKIASFDIKHPAFLKIVGIKKYLELWEKHGDNKIFLKTMLASALGKGITKGDFEIVVYNKPFDAIKEKFTENPLIIEDSGTNDQWLWIIENINENERFRDFSARIFNIQNFDPKLLFSKWDVIDEKKRWIIWLWCKVESIERPYLDLIINESRHYSHLIEEIENGIFLPNFEEKFYSERKKYLEYFGIKELSQKFWNKLDEIQNPQMKIKCLTDRTDKEKGIIILIFKGMIDADKKIDEIFKTNQHFYPDVQFYFSTDFSDTFLQTYFKNYKFSKLSDNPSHELLELVSQSAKQNKILQYPTRNSILERNQERKIPIFWVDGLGLEWLGLLKRLLQQFDDIEFSFDICKANFPTDTENNKGWKTDDEVQRTLDSLGHQYRFPESFVKEMNEIRSIKDKIISLLENYKEIILTSDHGLTRFVKFGNNISAPDDAKIGPWGRYIEHANSFSLKDFEPPNFIKSGSYILSTTYDKFGGSHGLIGDVHGGATIEETLVPIINIRKIKRKLSDKQADDIKITLHTPKVFLNTKGEGQLIFELSKKVDDLTIFIGHQKFVGMMKNEFIWTIDIENLKAGDYTVKVKIFNRLYYELKFEIIQGIVKKDLGI